MNNFNMNREVEKMERTERVLFNVPEEKILTAEEWEADRQYWHNNHEQRELKAILITGPDYVSLRQKWVDYYGTDTHSDANRVIPIRRFYWTTQTMKVSRGKLTYWHIKNKPLDLTFLYISGYQQPSYIEFGNAVMEIFGLHEEVIERVITERRPGWAGKFMNAGTYTWMSKLKDVSPEAQVKRVFGEKYNRRVLRTMCRDAGNMFFEDWEHRLYKTLSWCELFPVEWVMDWFDQETFHIQPHLAEMIARDMAPHYNLRTLYNNLDASVVFLDAIRMRNYELTDELREATPVPRNMNAAQAREYHDRIMAMVEEIRPQREIYGRPMIDYSAPRELPEGCDDLQDSTIPDTEITVRFPESGTEMVDWSNRMSNCISGYVTDTESIFMGFYRNGQVFANAQIRGGGHLGQLLGRHNGNLPREEFYIIANWMVEVGLVKDKSFNHVWGYPREDENRANDFWGERF